MVNNSIMEQQEPTTIEHQNPDDVLLNPNRPKKEDWANLLDEHPDMPQHFKNYIDQQMADPLKSVDSSIFKSIKYWLEHPEISSLYRDQLLFNSICHAGDYDEYALSDGDGWKFSVPVVSIDF